MHTFPLVINCLLSPLCMCEQKCEYGSPEDFLCRALDAPQQQAVCNAVSLLRKIGACQQDSYALTPLGHHLAALPVNVKIGKMLIFGAIFGCLEPIVSIFRYFCHNFSPLCCSKHVRLSFFCGILLKDALNIIFNLFLLFRPPSQRPCLRSPPLLLLWAERRRPIWLNLL